MSFQNIINDELVAKLHGSPLYGTPEYGVRFYGIIPDLRPACLPTIRREPVFSSFGQNLDRLPAEIWTHILNILDFQSLSRLSRVSLVGKSIVEHSPAYRDVMAYAPKTLTALGKARLLKCHPAFLLRQSLYSDKCVSCSSFGVLLLLPTCERVCFWCMKENLSLRMTPVSHAMEVLGLTEKDLKKIPVMNAVAGIGYGHGGDYAIARPCRLVNVRQAKQLAVEKHGSVENLWKFMMAHVPGWYSKARCIFRLFQQAPLKHPRSDMSWMPKQIMIPGADKFYGVACMRMPYLKRPVTEADNGNLCRGCGLVLELYSFGLLPPEGLSRVLPNLPSDVEPDRPLYAMKCRLHTKDGFLEHIGHCYGVRQLLAPGAHDSFNGRTSNDWYLDFSDVPSINEVRQYLGLT